MNVLAAFFIVAMIATMPVWPYSRWWGLQLPAGLGLILLILLAAFYAPTV
jgi:hypothetical protein